jgi:hypothetical protein
VFEALPGKREAQLMDFDLLNWDDGFIVFRDYQQAWRRLNIVLAADMESSKLVRDRIESLRHWWLTAGWRTSSSRKPPERNCAK